MSADNAYAMAVMGWNLSASLLQVLPVSKEVKAKLLDEVTCGAIASSPELAEQFEQLQNQLLAVLDGKV